MAVMALGGCVRQDEGAYYSATGFAKIELVDTLAEAKIMARNVAEKKARDLILTQALEMRFRDGTTLGDAVISDPFIRAKVYDTIRTSQILDRTYDEDEGIITVTVRLALEPLMEILAKHKPERSS